MDDPKRGGKGAKAPSVLDLKKVDPAIIGVGIGKIAEFMTTLGSPAPRPKPAAGVASHRWQDDVIEEEIPLGASVLDLGCSGGELLLRLMTNRRARVQGVEINTEAVLGCVEKGVPVFQADLDGGLRGFEPESFDYVVLEETLQTLRRPIEVLKEMLRVGRRGIVSFPNFAYWRVRLELAVRGRMPVTEWLPYRWHDTPNIHLFTIQDFQDWAAVSGVRIARGYALVEGVVREIEQYDNLYAEEALLIVEKEQHTEGGTHGQDISR